MADPTSHWTLGALFEHFTTRADDASKALDHALAANEKRLDSMNEFRDQLRDQSREFIPRKEAELLFGGLSSRIDLLTAQVQTSTGRGSGLNAAWVILLGVLGAVATVYGFTR